MSSPVKTLIPLKGDKYLPQGFVDQDEQVSRNRCPMMAFFVEILKEKNGSRINN